MAQGNFHEHPLPRMGNAPTVDTHIVRSAASSNGIGKIALPPIASAIANAVFALSGRCLRSMRFRLD